MVNGCNELPSLFKVDVRRATPQEPRNGASRGGFRPRGGSGPTRLMFLMWLDKVIVIAFNCGSYVYR